MIYVKGFYSEDGGSDDIRDQGSIGIHDSGDKE